MFHEILDDAMFRLRKQGIPSGKIARELGDDDGKRLSAWAHDPIAKAAFDRFCAYLGALARHGDASVVESILEGSEFQVAPRYEEKAGTVALNVPEAFAGLTMSVADVQTLISLAMRDGKIDAHESDAIKRAAEKVKKATAGTVKTIERQAAG